MTILTAALATVLAAAPVQLDAAPQTLMDADVRCLLGVYSLPTGASVIITGVGGKPRVLQYTFSDGQFGTLKEGADGAYAGVALSIRFEPCRSGRMMITQGIVVAAGTRLPLIEKEATFTSDGVKLHGKLVLPTDGRAKSAAIWVEGSNNDPSTDDNVWQYELARRGVATFVYDKRGTGASGGALSANFHARARDTAAALKTARELAPGVRRIGVIGGSQGGWVAPLTATLVRMDFVIAAFATAESPISQDRELVEQQVGQAGFDAVAVSEAKELTAITERIVRSNMRDGLTELDSFKAKHADAPWLKAIQPRSYTGIFLKLSTAELKSAGPALAQGLTFDFEPRPVIEAIKPRQLWLLGGNDRQAPNVATQAILREIQLRRRDVAVVVFPKADHGLIERNKTIAGVATAYSTGLFDIAADWIISRKLPEKGKFIVMPRGN